MIIYPSIGQYHESLVSFKANINTPEVAAGTPIPAGPIDFVHSSGQFAVVYKIKLNGNYHGLRLWLKEVPNSKRIYREIENYIKKLPLDYFLDYKLYDAINGISVKIDRKWEKFGFIFMDWIQGQNLYSFINDNIHQRAELEHAAELFLRMAKDLHVNKISHGDLQGKNILFFRDSSSSGHPLKIKLVDYDSMYVPGLAGLDDTIIGLAEYQSPYRKDLGELSPVSDYFSELVIYLSLKTYAECPQLWTKDQADHLLFVDNDFSDPFHSKIFYDLRIKKYRNSDETANLAKTLMYMATVRDIRMLLPLEKILEMVRNGQYPPKSFDSQLVKAQPTMSSSSSRPITSGSAVPNSQRPWSTIPGRQPTRSTLVCSACQSIITDPSLIYCPYCFSAIYGMKTCQNCGASNVPRNARYCPQCRYKQ